VHVHPENTTTHIFSIYVCTQKVTAKLPFVWHHFYFFSHRQKQRRRGLEKVPLGVRAELFIQKGGSRFHWRWQKEVF